MGDKVTLREFFEEWAVHVLFVLLYIPFHLWEGIADLWKCAITYRPKLKVGEKR